MRFNRFYFAALLLPLLVLLAVPPLRVPARRLASGQYRALFPVPLQPPNRDTSEPAQLSDEASLDAQIVGIARFNFPPRLRFVSYAELAREHPDQVLPLICALNWMQGRDGRIAGPWEDPAGWTMQSAGASVVVPTLRPGIGGPSSAIPENNYLPSDLILALELARRGQKLEPDNTFFDWMAARALFALNRDDEASEVLIAASRKTGFDLHYRDWWDASFGAAGRGAPLLAEEKTAQVGFVLLPYITNLIHVQRLALWSAMQKEDAGDVAGALEIEGALWRLLITMHRRALLGIESSIAARLVQGVWCAPADMAAFRRLRPNLQKTSIKPQMERLNRDATAFARYARRHNRSDLAREAARFATELRIFYDPQRARRPSEALMVSLQSGASRAAALSAASAMAAAWQLVAALGLWLFFTVWGPLVPPRRELETGGTAVPRLDSRWVIVPLVIGAALSLGLACLERHFLAGVWAAGFASRNWLAKDSAGQKFAAWTALAAIAAPLVLAMLACFLGAMQLKRRIPREAAHEFTARELGAPEALEWLQSATQEARKWLWLLFLPAVAATLWVFEGAMVATNPIVKTSIRRDMTQIFEVCLAAWLVFVFWRARYVGPRAHCGAVYAGLFALRRALAWTIPLSLWLLLLALGSGVAPRAQAERELQRFLRSENPARLGPDRN
jgi:hypothetical protein